MYMSGQQLIKRQTSISGNLVSLCRYLRTKGYRISSTEESNAMQSMALIPPLNRILYTRVLRAVLAKTAYQFKNFEDHLLDYEDEMKRAVDDKIKDMQNELSKTQKPKASSLETLQNWLYNKSSREEIEIPACSDIETLTRKEFILMTDEEIAFMLRLFEQISKRLARRKSRLRIKSKYKKQVDLRATIKHNLKNGREIRNFIYSKRKDKPLKIVVLTDVSKSMDLYSRFFLQMLYGFQNSYDRIDTFVFSTAMHCVTDLLDNHEFNDAFSMISERVPQWSGGTKIGFCLSSFVARYGHSMLDKKTIVLILSDGWDTGEPLLMKEAMREIRKMSRKILWLNPLAGNASFEPEVMGLQSAMPYVSKMYAAHNMESFKVMLGDL